jgi:bifunctional DNase/RNase
MTHDLYLGILSRAGIQISRIEIHQMLENTYYAKVYAVIDGKEEDFDSRPSDAVALALHEKCPIMINKALLHRELTPDEVKEYEDIVKTVKF